jgi:hypothetical protein
MVIVMAIYKSSSIRLIKIDDCLNYDSQDNVLKYSKEY